jgi:hypothetical protein
MSESCHAELDFIAANFSNLQVHDMMNLGYDDLYQILSRSCLKIDSEESIFEFVSELTSRDAIFFGLFEFVHFEYLSTESVSKFVELSFSFFSVMNSSIWSRICKRLIGAQPEVQRSSTEIEIPIDLDLGMGSCGVRLDPGTGSPGIIAYLTRKYGGNVAQTGVVDVIGREATEVEVASNVADLDVDSTFYSIDKPNQSICYDFKYMTVIPTHYSLKSKWKGFKGSSNLRSWVVEVSNDGQKWIVVDRVNNNSDLDGPRFEKTFAIGREEEGRFVRLRQTGKNHRGTDVLCISSFEIFGRLLSEI